MVDVMKGKWTVIQHYMRTKYGHRWSGREAFEAWQESRVLRHLEWVRRASPFYAELWGNRPLSEWRDFPAIDKELMMEHFDRLNTAGIGKDEAFDIARKAEETRDFTPAIGDVSVGLSSGTSGNRGIFLISGRERLAWAGTVLAKTLPRGLLRRERIAFFLRANNNLYSTVRSSRLEFAFFDLLDPFEEHLARLQQYDPTLLIAPPSVLRMLAGAVRDSRLAVTPRKMISVAEVLDPIDRRYIEDAFGQAAHQVYQCTEGFLAATCAHGTLHLNEDVVCIQKEYADEKLRKFVPIVTDFSRTTQPIVRYRLNDLLTERLEPCPCGSVMTAIESIEGRCDDLFYFPSVRGGLARLIPVFPDFLTRAVIGSSAEIEEYQIVQHSPDKIEISLRIAERSRAQVQGQVADRIAELCRKLDCRVPDIAFSAYRFIPGVRKLRRVERRCAVER
ncbi:hypothetical protein PAE9249_03406 [Paenibacillus sp. CECT 9249]|uniref:F390 synthetase-related protein n=1 Tax=Paenibacillus sp. CECT 9249 TaxID=2845385 RepID=UPI001E623621|nr:F390 synthetase-related protein [Paenibacillus sp. CECT 9249]CAH0120882.1 hypothetical protein PAE9249_03406 [Paenibacillus sp. CECT 9249]